MRGGWKTCLLCYNGMQLGSGVLVRAEAREMAGYQSVYTRTQLELYTDTFVTRLKDMQTVSTTLRTDMKKVMISSVLCGLAQTSLVM